MDYLIENGMMFEGGLFALASLMVLAGLIGSIGHCATMCGPFVLAQVQNDLTQGKNMFARLSGYALLPYHLGRMTTYALLGAGVALMGDLVMQTAGYQLVVAILLSVGGMLFMIHALPIHHIHRFLPKLKLSGVYTNTIGRIAAPFSRHQGGLHRYIYGLILGFLPCGFLYGALMVVAATGDPMMGFFGMIAFAFGTTAPLLILAMGGSVLAGKYPSFTSLITKAGMIFNSCTLFIMAGGVLAR